MDLMDMVVLRIDKRFPDKFILMLIRIRMRWCPTLDHKGRMRIVDLLSLVVVRNMSVGVWPVTMVAMGVVRVAT